MLAADTLAEQGASSPSGHGIKTLRPRQDGPHLPDTNLKWIFLKENVYMSIKICLEVFSKGPANNFTSLVQIMVWRQPGDKAVIWTNDGYLTDTFMHHVASVT